MLYISPYKMGSASAKSLARMLGVKRIFGTKNLKRGNYVVNWGNSNLVETLNVLNRAAAIKNASNKLTALQLMSKAAVPVVTWTDNKLTAERWLAAGHLVYCRTMLSSSSGNGIVIAKLGEQPLVDARLYTKGVAKAHEYRVHIFNDRVIDYTKKKRRAGTEVSGLIKNFSNGWVFCRDEVALPFVVLNAAKRAVESLGLNFGAVDIMFKDGVPYVLEVNTAPGIEGATLSKYVDAIRGWYANL